MPSRDTQPTAVRGPAPPLQVQPQAKPYDEALHGRDLAIGSPVGPYVVTELVSRGGFATIYKAKHTRLARRAAVKVMHRFLVSSANMVRRFQQEAQAVNLIHHPNIVDIFEFGDLSDGRPYCVMEWLEGRDLERELGARGRFAPLDALGILEDLGAALQAAHRAGVIHRDLKSSNVFLVNAGDFVHVKLIDFGIAKLTDASLEHRRADLSSVAGRLGTPSYMPPEQILGRPADHRADIYALGVLVFEMLAGRLPFAAHKSEEVQRLHLKAAPPPLASFAPEAAAVQPVIERCLRKRADERYDSVDEVLHALRRSIAPPRAPRRAAAQTTLGLALYVETCFTAPLGPMPDALLAAIEDVLAHARAACVQAGLTIAVDAAGALAGVALLPDAENGRALVRERALRAALALAGHPACAAALASGALAIALHVAPVMTCVADGDTRFLGGELLRVGDWATRRPRGVVTASRAATAGVEKRFELEHDASGDGDGDGDVVRIVAPRV
jgi:eukaryotic-like serine/threonine-protein kinase